MIEACLQYFYRNGLESIAFIISVLGVWLTIKEKTINWPIGIIACLLYTFIFFKEILYADASLQVVYIILGIYGWYEWLHGGEKNEPLKITSASGRTLLILALITLPSGLVLGKILSCYTTSNVPYLDALLTAFSLAATWLAAKKLLENWLLWVFTDLGYVILYIVKHLYLTSVLYFIFTILAIYGHFAWKKLQAQNSSVLQ
jgi:nicotinamide mononucleotide transporter